jgi:hypothetical protein
MIDVERVDLLDRRRADRPRGLDAYLLGQRRVSGIEPLRIVDACDLGAGRNMTAAATTGPASGPTPTSSTRDVAHTGLPQQLLEVPHGLEAQAFVALVLEAFLQRRVEPAHALTRIALQARQNTRRYRFPVFEIALSDLFDRKLVHTACHSVSVSTAVPGDGQGSCPPPKDSGRLFRNDASSPRRNLP